MGYNPWGHQELDKTEQLTLSHFLIGKNPVQSHELHLVVMSLLPEQVLIFIKYIDHLKNKNM